jgi:DNA polymerase elongation subunit (family B)
MRILLLDLETAPHIVASWGLFDQTISIDRVLEPGYTLSFAAKWLGEKKVMFNSVYKSTPRQMLKEVYALLEEADAVITYNGDRFDIPTLNKDFVKHNLGRPIPVLSIDLLKTVKTNFRLASNKLDFVLGYFGLGAKVQHKGMAMWLACMRNEAWAWKMMEKYNKGDVTELEKLYNHLLPWIKNHPNRAIFTGERVCPICGSSHVVKKGVQLKGMSLYQRYKCKKCGAPIRGENITNMPAKEKLVVL